MTSIDDTIHDLITNHLPVELQCSELWTNNIFELPPFEGIQIDTLTVQEFSEVIRIPIQSHGLNFLFYRTTLNTPSTLNG